MKLYTKTIARDQIQYTLFMGIVVFILYPFYNVFTLKICGKRVFYSYQKDDYKIYYFFSFPVWRKNCSKQFFETFLDSFINKNPHYDDYYVFLSHGGEFFLLMHHMQEWLKKNHSEKFLFVLCKPYHESILKIFFPNIPYVNMLGLNTDPINTYINEVHMKYQSKNIFIPIYYKYCLQTVENAIQKDRNAHFYGLLKNHLQLNSTHLTHFTIATEAQARAKHIAETLLKNNFIILSPETISNVPLPMQFWEKLAIQYKGLGYEVYTNCVEIKSRIPNTYALLLSYEEIIELARYAKAIIGIRSGFLDCLSQQNVPLYALYTDFPERGAYKSVASNKIMTGFSLAKLPNVNKDLLFEYDVNSFESEDSLIEDIMESYKKLKFLNKNC